MRPLRLALAVCAVAVATTASVACARAPRGGAVDVRATAATTGALGATSGVRDAGAGARGFRIVPLGSIEDVEILSGHPDSAGVPFVMRIRELPGTIVPPHSHPVDEHLTVVSGSWQFGTGATFDSTALRTMRAGDYAFAPAGTTMFAASPTGGVVQVHGIGPFHIHWRDGLHVLGAPGAERTFRYRMGDSVTTPRGSGVIRAGYASGALVQYEVRAADGARFMVTEPDVRR